MRLTRAYFEGYTTGYAGVHVHHVNPHTQTQNRNAWFDGYNRGVILRHFHAETEPSLPEHKAALDTLKKELKGKK